LVWCSWLLRGMAFVSSASASAAPNQGAGSGQPGDGAAGGAVELCVWGLPGLSFPSARALFVQHVGAAALVQLRRVVERRTRRVRFDVTLDASVAGARAALDAAAAALGWRVKSNLPYGVRKAIAVASASAPGVVVGVEAPAANGAAGASAPLSVSSTTHAPRPWRIMTWNVGTLTGKLVEVNEYIFHERVLLCGLQETLRHTSKWPLHMRGYTCLSRPARRGVPGARGVALVADRSLSLHELACYSNDNAVWARVMNVPGSTVDWVVASFYVPAVTKTNAARRKAVKGELKDTLAKVSARFPGSPIVAVGDGNMSETQLGRLVSGVGCYVRSMPGEGTFRKHGGGFTKIDHMIVNDAALELISECRAAAHDISAHRPLVASLTVVPHSTDGGDPPAAVAATISPAAVMANLAALADAPEFTELTINDVEETDPNNAQSNAQAQLQHFYAAARAACASLNLYKRRKPGNGAPIRYVYSRGTKSLIATRRRAGAAVDAAAPGSTARAVLMTRYQAVLKATREAQRRDERRSWLAELSKLVDASSVKQPKRMWRWVKGMLDGHGGSAGAISPLKNDDGVLQTDPSVILALWASFYSSLSSPPAAVDGAPNKALWTEEQWAASPAAQTMGALKEELPGSDADLTWREVAAAIRATDNGKAAGSDGLPPEFFKAALRLDGSTQEEEVAPTSAFAERLFELMLLLWTAKEIPEELCAAIVVPIPKAGGDPTVRNDYRGISLIPVLLKILARVAAVRITEGLSQRERTSGVPGICREQAGFLAREECMGQVCALLEVLQRRQRQRRATYICYVDFKKAFDMVAHGALFLRLHHEGVRGQTLTFVKALYANCLLRVRVGEKLTETIELKVGVRQGCPLSPILFDLFINSILANVPGITVAIKQTANGQAQDERLPGLMFADDVALVGEDVAGMHAALQALTKWADDWGMLVGHAKCGIQVVSYRGDDGQPHADAVALQTEAKAVAWMLQGKPVPVVDTYKYLGVVIDHHLTLEAHLAKRLQAGQAVLSRYEPLLRNRSVPLSVRLTVFKTCVQSVLASGGEVMGFRNEKLFTQLQYLQTKALRWMVLGHNRRSTSTAVLHAELGVAPLVAIAAGAKARALRKYPELHTWIATLLNDKSTMPAGKQPVWSRVHQGSRFLPGWRVDGAVRRSHKTVAAEMRASRAAAWVKVKGRGSVAYAQYSGMELASTVGFVGRSAPQVRDAASIGWLVTARSGGVASGYQQAASGWLSQRYATECVACGASVHDDVKHITCACTAYAAERLRFLAPIWARYGANVPMSESQRLAAVLGGKTGMEAGDASWLPADGDEPASQPGYLLAARFFGRVLPRHTQRIRAVRAEEAAQG
jgi:hypothetical protein